MRFLLHLALAISLALVVGFGLSWYALTGGRLPGILEIGPWTAWRDVGTPSPDPYTRAYIARNGALELGSSEGLQFTALTDSDNRPLDRDCTYRIDGATPLARFWTLAPVDEAGTLIAAPGGALNFESGRIARVGDGSIELYVGKALRPRNWLEIAGEGPFSLVLTLYDTSSLSGVGADVASLPTILREGCA